MLLLALVAIGWWGGMKLPTVEIDATKSDTVFITDTIYCDVPVMRDSVVTRCITRWLIKAQTDVETSGTVAETSGEGTDEPPDSVEAEIPITQKVYADNNYTAWVSGYEASLDSIHVYKQTEVVNTIQYIKKKEHRWGVMIGAGAGVNTKGQATPMVGVMVGYKLF